MVRRYKITYWHCGNKKVLELQASSKYDAKLRFYVQYPADDIISIQEVIEE